MSPLPSPFTRPGGASWAPGDGRDGPAAAQRRARACGPAAGRGHPPGPESAGSIPTFSSSASSRRPRPKRAMRAFPSASSSISPGIDQARFSLDQGAPLVSVPASDAFADAEARASSVVRALTHANLHRDLAATCRTVQVLESVVGVEGPPALGRPPARQRDAAALEGVRGGPPDLARPASSRHGRPRRRLRGHAAAHGSRPHLSPFSGCSRSGEGSSGKPLLSNAPVRCPGSPRSSPVWSVALCRLRLRALRASAYATGGLPPTRRPVAAAAISAAGRPNACRIVRASSSPPASRRPAFVSSCPAPTAPA